MIAAPAVDLKGGRCVQLVGGRPEDERISLPDPVAAAIGWKERGFATLHVVDLDAALGTGDNLAIITRIAREIEGDLQVGGGIRDDDRADALLAAGADRIIVGTRAIDDPPWLATLADRLPGRVVVAADVRDGAVLKRGWTEDSGIAIESFLESVRALPLAGILCTDVGREGRVKGIDRDAVSKVLDRASSSVWVSGGISTLEELRFLSERGAAGAVLGMAIYTGALDVDLVAEEFGR